MIEYTRFVLENGLRLLVHEDNSTPLVAVNLLYNVGARDESPEKTGFAHLFEHLMFSGSTNAPNYDDPLQEAGGDCNAFTNNDITNFYDILPAQNLETALWLESDRMLNLQVDAEALEVQRKVVLQEFNESCLNQPYGDVWHHLAELAFKIHPYRWPTIGKVPRHIEEATIEEVRGFFSKFYKPNNAVLVVAGNIKSKEVKSLVEKWFGDIPPGKIPARKISQEPPQTELQELVHRANVPVDAVYLAFHIPGRLDPDYYTADLISDILSNGSSSRLFRRLLKEKRLFSQIDAFITGNIDPGLLIIEGKPVPGTSVQQAEEAIWEELEDLKARGVPGQELKKVKNKVETTLVFSETNILNKAINLSFFELLGNADLINEEANYYLNISESDIQRVANEVFTKENCSRLVYLPQG